MSIEPNWSNFNLGTPANYVIRVRGFIDETWAVQKGLGLEHTFSAEKVTISTLSGKIIDQAALFGILQGLYSFGFPLLSVECALLNKRPAPPDNPP